MSKSEIEVMLDDLVDCWHTNTDPNYLVSLEDFILANIDWTHEQYQRWVIYGEINESNTEQADLSAMQWENDGGVPPRRV